MFKIKIICVYFIFAILSFLIISSLKLDVFGSEDPSMSHEIYVTHSILDEIFFETYINYIKSYYGIKSIDIKEVMLFQFIKPKGLNNQQLSIDYAVLYDENIHYGTLLIEVKSIFSFVYTNNGKMISAMSTIVLFSLIEVIKRKIKKR
jgi:hypothetical protein